MNLIYIKKTIKLIEDDITHLKAECCFAASEQENNELNNQIKEYEDRLFKLKEVLQLMGE